MEFGEEIGRYLARLDGLRHAVQEPGLEVLYCGGGRSIWHATILSRLVAG